MRNYFSPTSVHIATIVTLLVLLPITRLASIEPNSQYNCKQDSESLNLEVSKIGVPFIKEVEGLYIIALPERMDSTLHEYYPDFCIYRQDDYRSDLVEFYTFTGRQAPFGVIGDFNGDTIIDVALYGHDKEYEMALCILSEGNGYTIKEVSKKRFHEDEKKWVYLTLFSPNKVSSPYEDYTLELKTDAIGLMWWEKAGCICYHKDGEFVRYTISD